MPAKSPRKKTLDSQIVGDTVGSELVGDNDGDTLGLMLGEADGLNHGDIDGIIKVLFGLVLI